MRPVKLIRRIFFFFLIVTTLLPLWSCAPIDPYLKIKQQYPDSTYYIGIGEVPLKQPMATNPRMAEVMARRAAENVARAEIARQIRTTIQEQVLDVLKVVQKGKQFEETQEITQMVESRTNEVLEGVKVVQETKDERQGVYRMVVVMPKDRAYLNRSRLEEELGALTRPPAVPQSAPPVSEPEEKPAVQEAMWVEGEGEAPLGLDTTFGEAKVRARDLARRNAIEKAMGIYLKSGSVVYNFQLVEDLVTTAVRGIIEEEQVLEEKTQEVKREDQVVGTIFYTKIRARVRLDRVEQREFEVKASLNRDSFQEGEEAEIHVRPDQDAYVYIFSISQDEKVWQLLPNALIIEHFAKSGEEFIFPDKAWRDRGVKLRVRLPPGMMQATEKIKVIASKKKLNLTAGKVQEAIFPLYEGKDTGMMADLLKELALLDGTEWAEATLIYEVRIR